MNQRRLEQILKTIKEPTKRIMSFMLAATTLWTVLTATPAYSHNPDTETGKPKYRSEAISHYNGSSTLEEKISSKGTPPDTLWTRTFGGSNDDRGSSVQQTTDGGYVITGRTGPYTKDDVWLIKTDANGNKLWDNTFGDTLWDGGQSVQQTTDGGYIITGHTKSYTQSLDVWLIKTDTLGNKLWDKKFGGSNTDAGHSVQQTSDGGFIITGYTKSYGAGAGNADVWLIKTDANGNKLWDKTFGDTLWDAGQSVQQTSDSGFIITGHTRSYGAGSDDVWLIKTDANGNKLWDKTFGGTFPDEGQSVQQTSDSGFIITGYTDSYDVGTGDVWLIKTDANGNKLWDKTFGFSGGSHDGGNSVQQTTDGGYIIVGFRKPSGVDYDVWLIKTGPEVGIEEKLIPEKDNIWLKPTVSNGIFATNYKGRVDAYDIAGKKVSSQNSDGIINLEELTSGIYFLKLEGDITRKVMKINPIR